MPVSRISSAAGRKALSSRCRFAAPFNAFALIAATVVGSSPYTPGLEFPQMGIKPLVAGKQGFVRSFFDDAAILHADDAIAMTHRGQPMGDNDDGSPAHDLPHVGRMMRSLS